MRLDGIKEVISQSESFQKLLDGVSQGRYPIGVYGVADSARAAVISTFYKKTDQSIYVFSWSDLEARTIYEDLLLWDLDVYFLPGRELVFYDADAVSGDLRWERLKVLREIASPQKRSSSHRWSP